MSGQTHIKVFLLGLALIICSFPLSLSAVNQDIHSRVKVALIYNFANNIEWANEKEIKSYRIGVFSSDSAIISEFKILSEKLKLKNKPIIISTINNTNQVRDYQILYFDQPYCEILPDVYRIVKGKNTLIISDKCGDRLFTMINLLYDNTAQTLSYEINKQNAETEGFRLNPDILLHGGSYIDLKELYISTYNQLRVENQKIRNIQELLEQIYLEKDSLQLQTGLLNRQISTLKSSRNYLEADYRLLTDSLEKKDKMLNAKIIEVNQLESQSHLLQSRIRAQLAILDKATDSLHSMNAEIIRKHKELEEKQQRIEEQNEVLSEKETVISDQKKLILVSIGFAFTLILALYTTYRAFRSRKEINKELELLVEKRTKELNLSREHFMNLFESSPISILEMNIEKVNDYIWSLGPSAEDIERVINSDPAAIRKAISLITINDANSATLSLLDYPTKKLLIENYHKSYFSESELSFKHTIQAIIRKQQFFSYETFRQTSKGEIKHLQISWIVLPGFEKTYRRVIVSMADITELTRHRNHLEELVNERSAEIINLNRELTETVEELENTLQVLKDTQAQLINSEKMASLGMLTAGIAHEINNPINYISASKQALDPLIKDLLNFIGEVSGEIDINSPNVKQNANIDEVTSSINFLLENMEVGIKRTTEIISSLMTYSRSGDITFKECNLVDAIKNTLIILHSKYKNRIQIIENYNEIPPILCSISSINQMLMNIIANAIDAIKDTGTITITTRYSNSKDQIILSVKDSGLGIPEDLKMKVFDPFFTTKEVGKGVGLGLYIAYRVVQQHGGTIDIVSSEGKGAEFIVKLPLKRV